MFQSVDKTHENISGTMNSLVHLYGCDECTMSEAQMTCMSFTEPEFISNEFIGCVVALVGCN